MSHKTFELLGFYVWFIFASNFWILSESRAWVRLPHCCTVSLILIGSFAVSNIVVILKLMFLIYSWKWAPDKGFVFLNGFATEFFIEDKFRFAQNLKKATFCDSSNEEEKKNRSWHWGIFWGCGDCELETVTDGDDLDKESHAEKKST